MIYREIRVDGDIDNKIDIILRKIGRWHNLTPKNWREDFLLSNKDIDDTVKEIKSTRPEDLFIFVAESENDLKGFIWAKKDKDSRTANIISLYVEEASRGRGIGSELKESLENWCRNNGVELIKTTVHYKNEKMLSLNKKMGYVPGMISMTKEL